MAKLSLAPVFALLCTGSLAHAGGPTTATCDQDPRCYARELAQTLTSTDSAIVFQRVVDFEPGRVRVYSKSREKLQAIAEHWKQRTDWSVITVHGYAGGSADLGQQRADKIRNYLIRYGVPSELVVATGEAGTATSDLSIALCHGEEPCRRTATASR
jgi:outer membrane protein OmpA-like peptidoglycan-associated protein